MTLRGWQENRWIDAHSTSPDEIARLLSIVDRDLRDAAVPGLSADTKGNLSYNACLQLATLAMFAEGYRPGRDRGHERAIASLRLTIGAPAETVDLLDLARRKRNAAQYGAAGGTSSKEAAELLAVATALRHEVMAWMKKTHPTLIR